LKAFLTAANVVVTDKEQEDAVPYPWLHDNTPNPAPSTLELAQVSPMSWGLIDKMRGSKMGRATSIKSRMLNSLQVANAGGDHAFIPLGPSHPQPIVE
jgi:hypothetical protein